jgi:hypothetical protein
MACTTLVRMRVKDSASTPISSRLRVSELGRAQLTLADTVGQ